MPEPDAVRAQVYIGPLTTSDEDGKYAEPQTDGRAQWQDYFVVNRYEKDHHVYMLPAATPYATPLQPSVAFVQLAAPTMVWVCDWTAEKALEKPTVPSPIPADPNWVLLDEILEPEMVTVGADGDTLIYRISGTYFYGCINPSAVTALSTNFPKPPWLEDSTDRKLTTGMFQTGISDTGSVYNLQTGVGG